MTKGNNLGFRFFVHCFMEWPELVWSIDLADTPEFVSKIKRLRIAITYFSKSSNFILSKCTNNVKNTQNSVLTLLNGQ
jgi:hypothetical protein